MTVLNTPQKTLCHLQSVTHEGKVVVLAIDSDGKPWYTVKQDGFEDSYLNTPAALRTGWENWQALELPNDADDPSVLAKETAELTYQSDPSKFLLRSRYQTHAETAVAPVQLLSALDHLYVFRQSKANTLLVDRFVLDGMTNKLNRKLEVRFKRSRQKYQSSKGMGKGNNGLQNVDSLDFRDANGQVFYEPTTELCLVNQLHQGWFAVVLVPTIENDVYRWHIFAYNSQTQKVELTTLRASDDGLFDLKDYNFFTDVDGELVPRKIPGVLKRTLDIGGVTVTNGLAATKYDLQQEQETQSGEKQLLRTATRLLLAVPTDQGTAAFSFAIANDGTLAQLSETPDRTVVRSQQREILLPLNTLDEIKAIGDRTPPPQGLITGMAAGTLEDDAEDLIKLTTDDKAGELATGDQVKISGTRAYQGRYRANKVDAHTFAIDLAVSNGLGYWEKVEPEEGGLIFDGMITAYEKTAEGKLLVTCPNHGLENGDEVQIRGSEAYDNTYPVQKLDDTHFVIERQWPAGEALSINVMTRKRRGLVFDGLHDYVEVPYQPELNSKHFTIEFWAKVEGGQGTYRCPFTSQGYSFYATIQNRWELWSDNCGNLSIAGPDVALNTWTHIAGTYDGATLSLYINGQCAGTLDTPYTPHPNWPLRIGAYGMEGPPDLFPGQIAEARVWNAVRSAEAIQNNMYLPLTGREADLVGYWRLGACAEQKVIDFSVHGYDGMVHGEPYVSAATLNRTVAGGAAAVKYSNPELFAVSERATYEETFEFKVEDSSSSHRPDWDYAAEYNAAKLFTFSHWGKTSRSAEAKITLPAVQNDFAFVGNGWYRASCSFTVPAGISLLRAFEIANLQGDWTALEIRKHHVRLVSDSITEARYGDSVTLEPLPDDYATLAAKLKELEATEAQEAALNKEKQDLEAKLAGLNNLEQVRKEFDALTSLVRSLTEQATQREQSYKDEVASPFNYRCSLSSKGSKDSRMQVKWRNELDDVFSDVSVYNVELRWPGAGDVQLWWFTPDPDEKGLYSIYVNVMEKTSYKLSCIKHDYPVVNVEMRTELTNDAKWKFIPVIPVDPADEGYYYICSGSWGDNYRITPTVRDKDVYNLEARSDKEEWWSKWKLIPTEQKTNTKIEEAYQAWQDTLKELQQKQNEYDLRYQILNAGEAEQTKWATRLKAVNDDLETIRAALASLNNDFLNGVRNMEQTAQVMQPIKTDSRGLVTQGAVLEFVRPISRLSAIETCEGNVQLSYFDHQGRMRQTNFDATADSKNPTLEQWLPDALRTCLNLDEPASVITLNPPIYWEEEWTLEAWFAYPLPEITGWNTLVRGKELDHHIIVKREANAEHLGMYLNHGGGFVDSGYNMMELAPGWHHLTAVAQGKAQEAKMTFYMDGQKVGEAKGKTTNHIYAIGNNPGGFQQFGKIAEVRIWGIALSDEEVAVNSKTLLSGNEPGLLAYYPLNEATGDVARNRTGNGHNGTITGASWWGCAAPIGKVGQQVVMQFDGAKAYVETPPHINPTTALTVSVWAKSQTPTWNSTGSLVSKRDAYLLYPVAGEKTLRFYIVSSNQAWPYLTVTPDIDLTQWHHYAGTFDGKTLRLYIDGVEVAQAAHTGDINGDSGALYIGKDDGWDYYFNGQLAEVCIWNVGLSQAEIQATMHRRLTGKEPNLVAYYPLSEIRPEGSAQKVLDLAGNQHGTVTEAILVENNSLPMDKDALISTEYVTVTLDPNTKRQASMMRRLLAYPQASSAVLLTDKRVEELELQWIGNGQFAPTLLGYIEGAPPIPSENLTFGENYNGVTSVELTVSEDVAFQWKRSQDAGLGGTVQIFAGSAAEASAGFGFSTSVAKVRSGFKGNLDFNYQFQNESSISSNSSLSLADKLQLCGSEEENAYFPHLGKRFIPKNVGYALVVSALADVFVIRLQRTGKMIGYQVIPVENIPPDVNTITFLINPAYTMSGSLDGLTGSRATSQRFFKHVPEMRAQFGALYPASYYRLQEAYDLKRQIEQQDKNRAAYFQHFNSGLVDEPSLSREADSGEAPGEISVNRAEDKPDDTLTDQEKQAADKEKQANLTKETNAAIAKQSEAEKKKRAEIDQKIEDEGKRSHATASFAAWQRKMEDIQIRAGKRNIVNTYVWDADGGLRSEAQSFANTAEHSVGGSFSLNAALGYEGKFAGGGVSIELTAQATVNLTQTMSKTEARSRGIALNVGFVAPSGVGVERRGVTDYNDRPILPGEKVNRYRFMSFYLEGSTSNFNDFFNYVVDPEWLASNSEEARALRQAKGKANKAWRVLHRVTYVERPALMGFGRDLRTLRAAAQAADNQVLLDKIAKLEENNKRLEAKLDQILKALQV